ncbi:hypothetical protein FRC04_001364 [Tulasnella sp. 424]|nr:hypothetical protein FRC04_001364 [Tulasnella sp. 424]KAG8968731.1 hypothetical protein FRC05_001443 [Tulasnella sp. 425]
MARYPNYVPEEETIRNDYSQRYVDSGDWPQNWVQGAEPERRFEEYPKQQRLLALKKASVAAVATPPMHIPLSSLASLTTSTPTIPKFDTILIDPPYSSSFSWDELENCPIPTLAADPSFVFLWVGSGAGEGLEKGRALLAKWGYRRCEDVVWIKTNNESNRGPGADETSTIFVPADRPANYVSPNANKATLSHGYTRDHTDVIIWEGDPSDPTRKPPEMYTLIENFCLGLRRLEIFGRPYSLRPGWVTCGDFELTPDLIDETGAREWDQTVWESEPPRDGLGRAVVPMSQEIDILRPKSPNRPGHASHASQGSQGGSVGSIPPQYTGGSPAVNMGMGNGPGHILPPRPMNMNQQNARNPNGAFSGGVGLGIVRPQHQQQMPQQVGYGGMPGMNPMMNQQGMMGGAGPGGAFGGMGGRGMMPPNMAQMQGMVGPMGGMGGMSGMPGMGGMGMPHGMMGGMDPNMNMGMNMGMQGMGGGQGQFQHQQVPQFQPGYGEMMFDPNSGMMGGGPNPAMMQYNPGVGVAGGMPNMMGGGGLGMPMNMNMNMMGGDESWNTGAGAGGWHNGMQ